MERSKTLVFLLIGLLSITTCLAQKSGTPPLTELIEQAQRLESNGQTDSALLLAKRVYTQALQQKDEESIAKAQLVMADVYFNMGQFTESISLARQAEASFKRTGDVVHESHCKIILASHAYMSGNKDSSKYLIQQAMALAERSGDPETKAYVNLFAGENDMREHEYGQAADHLFTARKLYDSLNNFNMVASTDVTLADSYSFLEKNTEAKRLLKSSIRYFREKKNYSMLVTAYSVWFSIYIHEKKYDSAKYCILISRDFNALLDDVPQKTVILYNLGISYLNLHQYDSALLSFQESFAISQKISEPEGMVYALLGMVRASLETNKYALAKKILTRIDSFPTTFNPALQIDIYRYKSKSDSAQGNFKESLAWFQKFHNLNDSLKYNDSKKKLAELQARFETEKKEQTIRILTEEKRAAEERDRLQQHVIAIIVGVVALLLIAVLIVIIVLRKRNLALAHQQRDSMITFSQRLTAQNHELHELHEEKDRLIGIVAHDLRSPLRKTLGLVDLLGMEGLMNERQEKLLALLRQVNADGDSLVSELLNIHTLENDQASVSYETVNLPDVLQVTLEHWKPVAADKNIELHYEGDRSDQPVRVVPAYLTRVLDNIISNAIKYSHTHTTITITQHRSEVTITDRGQGMTTTDLENLFKKFGKLTARPTAGESSSGLGLYIVKTLMDRMNSTISVESNFGQGTSFKLRFPETA